MMDVAVLSDREADLVAAGVASGLQEKPSDGGADELGLDPFSAAVLVGSALAIGKFVLTVIERWKGGIRIDLATKPATVERLRDVPYGVIVILTRDGEVRIETVEEPKDAVERMIVSVIKLPVDAAASLVSQTLATAKGAAGA
jgi:hypothetical protein